MSPWTITAVSVVARVILPSALPSPTGTVARSAARRRAREVAE